MKGFSGRPYHTGVLLLFFMLLITGSCKSFKEQENELPDSRYKGKINVSADESFKPVVDELVQVYESNYPGTIINVQYKPEAECLQDFAVDSIRIIIATRSEERRVGKECRSGWATYHEKK